LEKEAKLKSTESSDENYVYFFDESQPIYKQAILKEGDKYLLNVRKIYTDDLYYGVSFTTYDAYFGIQHQFRCKDRPLGDYSVVEDKNKFLSKFLKSNDRYRQNNINLKVKEAHFKLPYKVFFYYDEHDRYHYTQYLHRDGKVLRGLYGAKDSKDLQRLLKEFNGFATLGEPTKNQIINFYQDKINSYSNNQISVSTDYSKIIVEHSTQYEQEWSDIKRRKSGPY
jgi:hypothetical protein